MELYIPHTFSNTKAKKLWFNSICFRAIKNRGEVQKWYRSHPSAEIHALYISARNHAKSILQFSKILSLIENVKMFLILTILVISGI